MNDLYREKGLSPKQIYNRRLKDQKPVIEDFLLWLDQLHPESGDRLIKQSTIPMVAVRL